MSSDPRHLAALTACGRLLEPLVPLLLELGIGVGQFEDLIRSLYVQAAKSVALRSRKGGERSASSRDARRQPSVAAIAMLTGLTRAVVAQLLDKGSVRAFPNVIGHQRAERVLSGWQHDPDFRDDRTGTPALLALRGTGRTFTALVKRHSGDPRVRTLLTELLRVRAVRRHRDGRLELIRSTYASRELDPQGIALIGEYARDYLQSLVGNARRPAVPLYMRRVMNTRFDSAEAGKLLRDIALQADATMESVDAAINDPSATVTARDAGRPMSRLGATFFVFHDVGPSHEGSTERKGGAHSPSKHPRKTRVTRRRRQ